MTLLNTLDAYTTLNAQTKIAYNSHRGSCILLSIMHELSITQGILSIVLEQAEANQAGKVVKVNLTIGELSGVVDECVQLYFDLLSKDTIAAEATLSFNRPPARLRCRSCGATFSPDDLNWACPNCQEQKVEIISGRECYVESIEVE